MLVVAGALAPVFGHACHLNLGTSSHSSSSK